MRKLSKGSSFMKKVSFMGCGNMASAIASGMLNAGVSPASITVYDKFGGQCAAFEKKGVKVATSVADAAESGDFILLAVKPQNFSELLTEIAECGVNVEGKVFISIAAGISTSAICKMLGKECGVVRCMPNTPLQISKGVTAVCRNAHVSDEDFDFAAEIFEKSGMVMRLDESELNKIICVNGSSPAYFYYFIDAVVKSAAAQNIDCDEKTLTEAVCRTVIGSAEMLLASGKSAEELIRAVTSPKGTTERAMNVLYNEKVGDIIHRAMLACTDRAEEMSEAYGK